MKTIKKSETTIKNPGDFICDHCNQTSAYIITCNQLYGELLDSDWEQFKCPKDYLR